MKSGVVGILLLCENGFKRKYERVTLSEEEKHYKKGKDLDLREKPPCMKLS